MAWTLEKVEPWNPTTLKLTVSDGTTTHEILCASTTLAQLDATTFSAWVQQQIPAPATPPTWLTDMVGKTI